MANVRHSSSKLAMLVAAATLAACAGGSELRLLTLGGGDKVVAAPELGLKPTVATDEGTIKIKRGKSETIAKVVPAGNAPENSAWCEHLREDSAAQATILRSPSLSGSVNDEAQASLSLGMSGSGFMKAKLLEEAAEVRCRRYLAEAGLQKLIFVSPQGLTSAGFAAKAKSINARKPEIEKVRRMIRAALQAGDIDQGLATQVGVLADQIIAEASAAKSQSDRRLEAVATPTGSAAVLAGELLAAESELEDINSRMRTLDSFDVSASVGWSDDANLDGLNADKESFNGNVSFTLKLGSVLPQRREHEQRAKDAKLRALAGEEGSVLWQVATLRRAHERALNGLSEQAVKLAEAIAKAERLERDLTEAGHIEFVAPLAQARLQLIRLKADKAAIAGSIAEIETNMKKLQAS